MFSVLDMHYYRRILTEPKNALIPQYQMLFGMDKVELKFTQVGASPESEALKSSNNYYIREPSLGICAIKHYALRKPWRRYLSWLSAERLELVD